MPVRDRFGGGGGAVGSFLRRIPPVTLFVLAANALTFLASFFLQVSLSSWLAFRPVLAARAPWTALTYAFATGDFLTLVLLGFVFWWVGSDLERRWGSIEFGAFLVAATLLNALSFWAAWMIIAWPMPLVGLSLPFECAFIAWCMLNPNAIVRVYFVLPVQARILGYVSLVATYFLTGHPILGLFALVAPLASWWYAVRGRFFRVLEQRWRSLRGGTSAFSSYAPPGRPSRPWHQRMNPIAWYQRRKRRQDFERMMRASGLTPSEDDKRSDWDRTLH